MLVNNLMNEIGFTKDEQNKYYEYKNLIGTRMDSYAEDFMRGKLSFNEVLDKVHKFQSCGLHQYTIDLLFVLECTSFLLEKYESNGISKKIFIDAMKDIKYKVEECIRVKNIFGIFVVKWYEKFLDLKRIALGRLQYDISTYNGDAITINNYTIHEGDFVLWCHIPSSGPLNPELCIESFKMAYDFFADKLNNGILPIMCCSWLLYPQYREVFGEKSNIANFKSNFEIIDVQNKEKFDEMWRVFGVECDSIDINDLPSNTTMQKNFIQYMKKGYSFGVATGFILFDGENVLTKNNNK
ncbi:MAG: acyltransferase domain-containing protein [Clostridia bacterium]|nr:acyltransferase domain-containing protein [Clostridia bacterium]